MEAELFSEEMASTNQFTRRFEQKEHYQAVNPVSISLSFAVTAFTWWNMTITCGAMPPNCDATK
jgi:hypothetical protein